MPRTPRSALPDGPFHVMSHAVQGQRLFWNDDDRRKYLELLQIVVERERWRLMTFALMDNHVHLLVFAETTRLSDDPWAVRRK